MEIIRHSPEVLEAKLQSEEFSLVWISDLHFDSKYSEWEKVKKYLNENPETYIVIGGDGLDVMQFVNDKRGTKGDTKGEYNHTDYANRIISSVRREVVEPFKHRIISWNRGNHDNSIIKYHNIDLLSLICGVDVPVCEYEGYIIINSDYKHRNSSSQVIQFTHSPTSGGTRSKGSLSIDLAKAEYPSADIWIREHIHDGFISPIRHEFLHLTPRGVKQYTKWYIQNIAAKQESQGPRNGFHYETNKGNRASGFVKMNFKMNTITHGLECIGCNHILF